MDAIAAATGEAIVADTADAGYAYGEIYGELEPRGIEALIPAEAEPIRSPLPLRRFRHDAQHDIVKCPRGRTLCPQRLVKSSTAGSFMLAPATARCPMRRHCLSSGWVNKAIVIGDDYPALLRARRRRERWSDEDRRLYQHHRWRVEGVRGEAKTWYGLARAVRRGLASMQIQGLPHRGRDQP